MAKVQRYFSKIMMDYLTRQSIKYPANGRNWSCESFIFFATNDYIAIGSNKDYLYIPLTPLTAQYLADKMSCMLPTKKIVDIIYNKAEVILKPNTYYAFVLDNNETSAQWWQIRLEWYEHTDKS